MVSSSEEISPMLVQNTDPYSAELTALKVRSADMAMAPYTISIRNKSGETQSYAIYAEPPVIETSSPDKVPVKTYVISVAHGAAPENGEATFILSKNIYATCGTYDVEFEENPQSNGGYAIGAEVIDQRSVILGSKTDEGTSVPGTTLQVQVSDGCPTFGKENLGSIGALDCFAMKTSSDFKPTEAKMNKFVLGFSSSLRHSVGPYATWVPLPSQTYQVKPSQVFYIITGSFISGDVVDVKGVQGQPSTCKVDFGKLRTDFVQLIHDERNTIKISILADS